MNRTELAEMVREIEEVATEPAVSEALKDKLIKDQPDVWKKYLTLGVDVDQLGDMLDTASLADLEKRLAELSGELTKGVKQLKDSIEQMDDAIEVVNIFAKVLELAARVAVLV